MSNYSITRARLIALCSSIVLPNSLGSFSAYETEEECSFSSDNLPAMIIMDAPDETYLRIDDGTYQSNQEFLLLMYVSHMHDESYRKNVEAWDLVADCRESVADFFFQKPTLALNDAGIVDAAQLSRGRKQTLTTKAHNKYHGAVFRLSVSFTRYVNQYDD